MLRMYGKVDLVVEGDDEVMTERDICVGGGLLELRETFRRMFYRGNLGWVSG